MKRGKIAKAVLERSVLRTIKTKNEAVLKGAMTGGDSSVFDAKEKEAVAVSTRTVCVECEDDLKICINKVLNNLFCQGSIPTGLMISVLLPEAAEETELKELMKTADRLCTEYGIQIAGGHTQVTACVENVVVTVTAVGAIQTLQESLLKGNVGNQDLVLTKAIALEGSAILAKKKEEELLKRLPRYMVQTAIHFMELLSVRKEGLLAAKHGVSFMHDLSEGGVFGALWEFAEMTEAGFEVDLKKIPVYQETIEICEQLQINPYELASAGSLLISCENGYALADVLKNNGIEAVVIGRTTDNNDKVICNEEERRFLEPVRQDSLFQVLE